MEDFIIYYSDTDSVDLDKPLPDKYVGEDLGQFKLEHIFDEGVFLSPKVYGGKTPDYEYVKVLRRRVENLCTFLRIKKSVKKGRGHSET